jgi:hypothetical protein
LLVLGVVFHAALPSFFAGGIERKAAQQENSKSHDGSHIPKLITFARPTATSTKPPHQI